MWEDVVRARCGNGQFPKPSLSLSTPKPSISIEELFTCYFQMVEKNVFPSLATKDATIRGIGLGCGFRDGIHAQPLPGNLARGETGVCGDV